MRSADERVSIDRRTAISWVMAASASTALWEPASRAVAKAGTPGGTGYGTDPELNKIYPAGELWPLTLSEPQRLTAAALCSLIIPADAHSPSAAQLNVHLFIDEWISAPYAAQAQDRKLILDGFTWLDEQAQQRFSRDFAALGQTQQSAICDDICYQRTARPQFASAARFFARYRDLTAGGFYTTPQGRTDLKYIGNVPLASFDGPPLEALKKVGLA